MHNYFDELLERNAKLARQVADLLPWAKLGAEQARTDSNWNAAVAMTDRIRSGEFGDI